MRASALGEVLSVLKPLLSMLVFVLVSLLKPLLSMLVFVLVSVLLGLMLLSTSVLWLEEPALAFVLVSLLARLVRLLAQMRQYHRGLLRRHCHPEGAQRRADRWSAGCHRGPGTARSRLHQLQGCRSVVDASGSYRHRPAALPPAG
jgi:hypothetical protein